MPTWKRSLRWLDGEFAMVRMDPTTPVPDLASIPMFHLSRTPHELSMTVPVAHVPANATRVERGWSGLMVEGPLDFALVGVLAELSGALADASISLCAISTWDTDYLLVRAEDRQRVTETLERQGWTFEYTGNSHPS